ncbi:cbb3-type cytochrome oxidase subunit 3 [Catenuloplanes nepalensis]|uniref:Cbb3-type cytochrome oxidase subunit 3 n=1 Tax=Catenuloplanes nepalensis TaxID=587533 RepID=A0ABT9N102_9ACTN|nr:cbb3-type cytochrome oxidase subunit 3 [Catenuloplanes nepalensis]
MGAMLFYVLEVLTGTGLAASAGLNAYIPMLAMGLLARYTEVINLPSGWQWLSNGWVIAILTVLLAIEFVADKIPVVDHINDLVQTVVRPTAGGLVFGAGAGSETVTVTDPANFFESNQWVPIAAGVVIALGVHGLKAAARPVINTATAGIGAPVASTAEDATSVIMSIVAILLPALVLVFAVLLIGVAVWVFRRRSARRSERAAARAAGFHA